MNSCELCTSPGGVLLWQSDSLRVVRVADPDYPGFCRVIWQDHVREMTDLSAVDRARLMETVFATEAVVRSLCHPDKINLASFGNMTPHLHWHVIPRWTDDRHFPQPVWAAPQQTASVPRALAADSEWQAALTTRLGPSLTATPARRTA